MKNGPKMEKKWKTPSKIHSFARCPAGGCFPFGFPFFPISGFWPVSMPYQPAMIPNPRLMQVRMSRYLKACNRKPLLGSEKEVFWKRGLFRNAHFSGTFR